MLRYVSDVWFNLRGCETVKEGLAYIYCINYRASYQRDLYKYETQLLLPTKSGKKANISHRFRSGD
jgi:hypothetical protein